MEQVWHWYRAMRWSPGRALHETPLRPSVIFALSRRLQIPHVNFQIFLLLQASGCARTTQIQPNRYSPDRPYPFPAGLKKDAPEIHVQEGLLPAGKQELRWPDCQGPLPSQSTPILVKSKPLLSSTHQIGDMPQSSALQLSLNRGA
jgi:hypothetical protein